MSGGEDAGMGWGWGMAETELLLRFLNMKGSGRTLAACEGLLLGVLVVFGEVLWTGAG